MEWSAPAYVLRFQRQGERDAVVSVLAQGEGRYVGLVRAGQASKHKNNWQMGHGVQVNWRARLPSQLGYFAGELRHAYSATLLHQPLALAVLVSACTLVDCAAPERMNLPQLFTALDGLLPNLLPGAADMAQNISYYIFFELMLLEGLGYGLDLRCCAVTGASADLAFVSPKTGRAVSRAGAGSWAPRLLALPPFLLNPHHAAPPPAPALQQGLTLTGHFLETHLFPHLPAYSAQAARAARSRVCALAERLG